MSSQQLAPEVPWQRVHPATPYVRGWLAIVVIVVAGGRQWLDGFFSPDGLQDVSAALPWVVGGGLGILAVVVLLFWIQWRFMAYRVTPRHVQMRRGVFVKQQREARLDRVQAIDLVRPLLPRLLGLAELRFEVADGGESALRLEYLKLQDAEALRVRLLALASGARGEDAQERLAQEHGAQEQGVPASAGGEAPAGGSAGSGLEQPAVGPGDGPREGLRGGVGQWASRTVADFAGNGTNGRVAGGTEDGHVLFEVPLGRLIGSTLLGLAPWILGLGALMVGFSFISWGISLGAALPAALAFGAGLWGAVNSGYRFRASVSADGLRLRQGLTESTHRTVPPGRVQAVRVRRPLVWRPFGWVSVDANIAGYGVGGGDGGAERAVLLPVGTLSEAAAVLGVVLPDPGLSRPDLLLVEGLDGSGRAPGAAPASVPDAASDAAGPAEGGFVGAPRSYRWLAPWQWRRLGFALTRTVLALRLGRWSRQLVLVPQVRVQGVSASQGPLARAAAVAAVTFHTTSGPVPTRLPGVPVAAATVLLDGVVERMRGAQESVGEAQESGPAPTQSGSGSPEPTGLTTSVPTPREPAPTDWTSNTPAPNEEGKGGAA